MRILLVNYRYFISGGPERYLFNIKEVLEKRGHEVIPFSVQSRRNEKNDYEQYFLTTVDDEVYFAQTTKSPRVVAQSFARMFYSFEAKRKMAQLIAATKPDIVYVLQMHNKISPSIVDAARERHLPVVHRISDFQYMCPNALFYNAATGVCEACLAGKRWHCVKNKCVLNSRLYSLIKMLAKGLHDMMGITKKIDAFVVPSAFTLSKLAQYGIPPEKLHHIPTFFNMTESAPAVSYEPFVLFVGRIEKQKGLMTLVHAFAETPYPLKIIGFSNDGYDDDLRRSLAGKRHNIEFLGRKSFAEIVPYLQRCLCTVVPSEWYDNFPNVILESFAYKKAVIATDFGSLPELVHDGETGQTFAYGSVEGLREKVAYMFAHPHAAQTMGEKAFATLSSNYTPEVHYEKLIHLFEEVINNNKRHEERE